MRSDLVFRAYAQVSSRYQLCQLTTEATRKFHRPNTRLQDTINDVLFRFQSMNPVGSSTEAASGEQSVRQRDAA
jgi:hypothetical protein